MKYVGWFYCIGDFELYPYYQGMHYPGCVGDCSAVLVRSGVRAGSRSETKNVSLRCYYCIVK